LRANRPAAISAAPLAPPSAIVDPSAVGRLLGYVPQAAGPQVATSAPNLASRFVLTGVVAGNSRGGAALIAVDGRPPKPFRVGRAIDEGVMLKAVQGRTAVLAATVDGPDLLTLELPPLAR
jgi:general secretion pathway protein C